MSIEKRSYGTRRPLTEIELGERRERAMRERMLEAAPELYAALKRAREAVNAIVLSTRSVSFGADLRAIDTALEKVDGTSQDLGSIRTTGG